MPTRGKGRGRGSSRTSDETTSSSLHKETLTRSFDAISAKTSLETGDILGECGLKLQRQAIFQYGVATRPDYGTLGKPINLVANCFNIVIPDGNVYHYDVEIQNKKQMHDIAPIVPSADKKKYRCIGTQKNRKILNILMKSCSAFNGQNPAYDGRKNLFTRTPLDGAPFQNEVILGLDNKAETNCETFVVAIKPVQKKNSSSCAINLNSIQAFFNGTSSNVPQEAFAALETIMRNTPALKLIPIGRSFFSPPGDNQRLPIGGGQEVWFGYHQSLRLGQWGPLVNLDISATSFYEKGPVLDFLCSVFNWKKTDMLHKPRLSDFEIRCMTKELRNMKIETHHMSFRKQFTVIRVTRDAANKIEFLMTKDGKEKMIKLTDYFQLRYKCILQYPHLPCLQVSPETKNIYLPMELCNIIDGQHSKKQLTDDQKKEMIKFTSYPPKDRFYKIDKIIKDANFNSDVTCKEFDLQVESKPTRVQGRVFDAPNVCYANTEYVVPRDGQWDMRNNKFVNGALIERWALISFVQSNYCSRDDLKKFSDLLRTICQERGMKLSTPILIETFCERRAKIQSILENLKSEQGVQLVVIAIPRYNKTIYSEIKQAAETVVGLITQCVKDDNVRRCNASVVKNLSLKLNAKLGGVNSFLDAAGKLPILMRPVIIIGADVTHPSPTERVKTSVAAVVGSLDAYPSRYVATCRAQTHSNLKKTGSEVIQELESMVKEILKSFYRRTKGKKPEKIIFYRDGVSDSQFESIREHEVRAIRLACKSLSQDYEPGITFIVVQKRHHMRFKVEDPRDGVGKCRNVPPGTTIDRTVIHPTTFDFFQCSHMSPLGTTRPAYYTVLADDNNFKADHLQKLTYHLCFTYARCTKSISIPAPIMYAHLAAFRARQWLLPQMEDSMSEDSGKSLPESVSKGVRITDELSSSMYFV